MTDSTSIASLSSNRVSLNTTEKPINGGNLNKKVSPHQNQQPSLIPSGPPASMQQMPQPIPQQQRPASQLAGVPIELQQAAAAGMTRLPSRDIPMQQHHITQDQEIKPNYIPEPSQKDYIAEHDSYESLVQQKENNNKEQNNLDSVYQELQTPLLATILFFFFQMPFLHKKLLNQFPSLFTKEGTATFAGYLTKTSLFGFSFYVLTKITKHLSEM